MAAAQIDTGILEKQKAALERQPTDPDQKRDGGTQPRDWEYQLPEGVRTRQVTFYVDGGTPLYGKLFLPKGFTTTGKLPAVVVGHGINALSIGIEKFAARFAERGLVAMAIDYQSYGFSGSGSDDIRLLEPDTTTDARAVTEKEVRILLKRTNLNNVHEVADFRAAVSFLQGEPGIDPDRIGIWGSSNGGAVVIAVAAVDARVKAVVSQVAPATGAARAGADGRELPEGRDSARARRTGRRSRWRLLVPQQDRSVVHPAQSRRASRPDARSDPADDRGVVPAGGEGRADAGRRRRDRSGEVPRRAAACRRRRSCCRASRTSRRTRTPASKWDRISRRTGS